MHHYVAMTRADHRQIVQALGDMRQKIRYFDSALPVSAKRSLGTEKAWVAGDELVLWFAEGGRPLLPVELIQQRLRVEGFQMTRSARHEKEDDRLSLRRQLGTF